MATEVKKTYWDTFSIPYQMGKRKHRMVLLDKMKSLGAKSFLDVGCGTGPLCELNEEYGFKYKGVDYSWAMIKIARGIFHDADFEVQDARKLKEKDGSWDVVVLMHCLDHLDDYETAISEAARVAKKHVIIILWRPLVAGGTRLNSVNTQDKEEGDDEPWEDTHLQEYSLEVLEPAFEKSKLKIVAHLEGEEISEHGRFNSMFILEK